MEAKDRIVCALDVDRLDKALDLVQRLHGEVGVFKVGLELTSSVGIQAVARLQDAGAKRIFLDAKLHDIPNTIAGAMRAIGRLGVWAVTLHASGGSAMLRAAADAARTASCEAGLPCPKLLGVTLLTSLGPEVLRDEMNVPNDLGDYVGRMARLASENGCDGVIVSPHEIETVRRSVTDLEFLVITPGVRPAGSAVGDQARVMTPAEAVKRGADYLVIGRPITAAPDPLEAVRRITEEMDQG